MSILPHRPCPVVLTAPSGTGKTSIARALVNSSTNFVFSVSATTRPPRPAEEDGHDYHFVSAARFREMADADELVEWAEVHGHSYGTPYAAIEGPVREGHHVVLDIDVHGARQVRDRVTEAVLIFVLPPNADVLVSRLSKRATEADAELERRLGNAREELEAAAEFDYVVVNDDLSGAVATVQSIVTAENHRPARAKDLTAVVARLKSDIDARLSTRTNVTNHETSTR